MIQFDLKKASILALVTLAAACSTTETAKKPVTASTPSQPSNNQAIPTVTPTEVDPLNDPKGILAKRSVYFDLDSYSVKSEYKDVVTNHSNYLTSKTDRKIVIQGNTDERGSSEYNLALGQRRAEAVKNQMKALGVKESQMETVSFGKEKPKAEGSNEAAWAENRRADIAY